MNTNRFLRALVAVAAAAPALLFAHGGEDHGVAETRAPALPVAVGNEAPARLADGSVFLPKASQNLLGVRTVQVTAGEVSRTVELKGRIKADPAAGGQVQAPQMGRVLPAAAGLPTLGQAVKAGQVLAWLEPVVGSVERSAQQAQLAQLQSALELAQRKLRRYEQLEGSIPQKEIEAARSEAHALQQQKTALASGLSGRLPLAAPATGVISNIAVVAGQLVEARDLLFSVVDPKRLIVDAVAYDTAIVGNMAAVVGATETGAALKLALLGAGLELREQALPVQLRVLAPAPALAIGQPVKVYVQLKDKKRGVVVPAAAVDRASSGDTVVWVHGSAERFEPRKVRTEALDAASLVVTDGLRGAERVVVQGVSTLSQVR